MVSLLSFVLAFVLFCNCHAIMSYITIPNVILYCESIYWLKLPQCFKALAWNIGLMSDICFIIQFIIFLFGFFTPFFSSWLGPSFPQQGLQYLCFSISKRRPWDCWLKLRIKVKKTNRVFYEILTKLSSLWNVKIPQGDNLFRVYS